LGAVEARSGLTFFEISKSFGPARVLQRVSLHVARGEVVALFGPNGAGKTTLLRVGAGIARPQGGRILVDGVDLLAAPARAKRQIGWAGEQPLLYDDLTAQENLEFFGGLYGLSRGAAAAAATRLLAQLGLTHRSMDLLGTLSHGMRQRVSVARALLHAPTVLLLDEPFEGLDPHGQAALITALRAPEARSGRAVLLATHQVDLGLAAADKVALIDAGALVSVRKATDTTPAALLAELRGLGGGPPHG
jgi:heme exporter protein A